MNSIDMICSLVLTKLMKSHRSRDEAAARWAASPWLSVTAWHRPASRHTSHSADTGTGAANTPPTLRTCNPSIMSPSCCCRGSTSRAVRLLATPRLESFYAGPCAAAPHPSSRAELCRPNILPLIDLSWQPGDTLLGSAPDIMGIMMAVIEFIGWMDLFCILDNCCICSRRVYCVYRWSLPKSTVKK